MGQAVPATRLGDDPEMRRGVSVKGGEWKAAGVWVPARGEPRGEVMERTIDRVDPRPHSRLARHLPYTPAPLPAVLTPAPPLANEVAR